MAKNLDEKEGKMSGNSTSNSDYEKMREQRIKENLEKMAKMGIMDLSRGLKSDIGSLPKRQKVEQNKIPLHPSRRSSRLDTITRVNYSEKVPIPKIEKVPKPKNEKKLKVKKVRVPKKWRKELVGNVEVHIKEGSQPEIYTEKHEQLLGDCKAPWVLEVDGFDQAGHRIYDLFEGKHCHQCRQTTLGHHTECSQCKAVEGQFCGDCLLTRYGENVIEANENPSWICPVCRGICNCSRCRRQKGWEPTGSIYWQVEKLGFKSVAHYLIQTKRLDNMQQEPIDENQSHAEESLPLEDGESKLTDGSKVTNADSEQGGSNGDRED